MHRTQSKHSMLEDLGCQHNNAWGGGGESSSTAVIVLLAWKPIDGRCKSRRDLGARLFYVVAPNRDTQRNYGHALLLLQPADAAQRVLIGGDRIFLGCPTREHEK